jgi:hypothetical protein
MKLVWWISIGMFLFIAAACDSDGSNSNNGNDTGSEPETNDGGDSGDENCIEGHDANNPAYRISGFVPKAPKPLADIAAGAQAAVDDGITNYMFTMSDVAGDGTVSGALGLAEATDEDDKYTFIDDNAPMTFEIDGNTFESTDDDTTLDLVIPLLVGDPLLISMHEVTLKGTFADDDWCMIGSLVDEGPPSEWETAGNLSGKLLVSETKDLSISITNPAPMTFSLCAYFAYGLPNALSLREDPDCEKDVSEWSNPPDVTTADGEDAWQVSADIAATAAILD